MDPGLALLTLRLVEMRVRRRPPGLGNGSRPSAMHPVRALSWALVGRRCGVMVMVPWWRLHAGTSGSKETAEAFGPQKEGSREDGLPEQLAPQQEPCRDHRQRSEREDPA